MIIKSVDWESKKKLREQIITQQKQAEAERFELVNSYNTRLEKYNNKNLKCPWCQNKNIRFVDRSPHRKSGFICRTCGRSFDMEDFGVSDSEENYNKIPKSER